jgi:hypothetical protein
LDRRGLFLFVFILTLGSTILVGSIGVWTEQNWLDIILYSLVTMWITGVVSQLIVQHLYLGIIRPLEEIKLESMLAKAKAEINIDEVEEIDQVRALEDAKKNAEAVEVASRESK